MLAVANTASNSPHPPTAKDCNPVSYADHAEEKREKREREREKAEVVSTIGGKPYPMQTPLESLTI